MDDTDIPTSVVRWIIDNEWVTTLDDLVQRRLMLSYDRRLTANCLHDLARVMSETGRFPTSAIDDAVAAARDQLRDRFARTIQ